MCHPDCSDTCALILPQPAWPLRRAPWLPEAQAVVATSRAIHCLLVANISQSHQMVEVGRDLNFPASWGSPKAPLGTGEPLNFHGTPPWGVSF